MVWLAPALLLAPACATTNVAPMGAQVQADDLQEDERYLWKVSREMQRRLDRGGLVYPDRELERYVNEVARRVAGDELAAAGMEPRVRVLSDVDMNAFAFSTGTVYLHTAILSRMDNEAQLATLLGHELSHTIYRHTLRSHRDLKNKTAFMSTAVVVTSAAPYGGLAGLLIQLGTVSSVFGYSRSMEREADIKGLERVARAGYDVRESPKLFQKMLEYQDELEAQGVERGKTPYFFSTHPRLKERIASYQELLKTRYAGAASEPSRVRGDEVFSERIEGVVVHQAAMEIDAGRYRSAQVTVVRALAHNPQNALAWVVLGEALQEQEGEENQREALAAFHRALEYDPDLPRAHRALAMRFYQNRPKDQASESARRALFHFQRYLELEPRAPDRGYAEAYVKKLQAVVPASVADTEGSVPLAADEHRP